MISLNAMIAWRALDVHSSKSEMGLEFSLRLEAWLDDVESGTETEIAFPTWIERRVWLRERQPVLAGTGE